MRPAPPAAAPSQHPGVALLVTTVGSFLTPFMGASINVALPAIGLQFGLDAVLLTWVAIAFLLTSAMLLVPFGRVADLRGRRPIFVIGVAVYAAGSFLSAGAWSATLILAGRGIQGIGSAMMFSTAVAILTAAYPAGARGRVLGINVAAVYLGLTLGPFLGGLITEHWGWRGIFWVNGLLALATLGGALVGLAPDRGREPRGRFDTLGSALYVVAMPFLMYGFSLLPAAAGFVLVGIGLGGLAVFAWYERRAAAPVLDLGLFTGNPAFAFANLAALINYSATAAIAFLLSLYLQYVRGLSPQSAGLVLVAQPVIMVLGSPVAGRLSDRVAPRVLASVGMGLTAVGLAFFALLRESTSLAAIVAALLVLGLGFALFSSPNTNAVMSSVAPGAYGVASATLGTMRQTGQMFSMGMAMMLLSVFLGRVQIGPEHHFPLTRGVATTFAVFALLCVAGVFASLARGRAPARAAPGS